MKLQKQGLRRTNMSKPQIKIWRNNGLEFFDVISNNFGYFMPAVSQKDKLAHYQ